MVWKQLIIIFLNEAQALIKTILWYSGLIKEDPLKFNNNYNNNSNCNVSSFESWNKIVGWNGVDDNIL